MSDTVKVTKKSKDKPTEATFMSEKMPKLEAEGYDDPKQRVAIALSIGRRLGVKGLPPEPPKGKSKSESQGKDYRGKKGGKKGPGP